MQCAGQRSQFHPPGARVLDTDSDTFEDDTFDTFEDDTFDTFEDDMDSSHADYIELSLQLQFNDRTAHARE